MAQSVIAGLHADAGSIEDTNWEQIARLCAELFHAQPSPVVELNRAVAVSMWRGPQAGLELLGALEEPLESYRLFHATKADLLRQVGRPKEAAFAYRRAIKLTDNLKERAFLEQRLREVESASDPTPPKSGPAEPRRPTWEDRIEPDRARCPSSR